MARKATPLMLLVLLCPAVVSFHDGGYRLVVKETLKDAPRTQGLLVVGDQSHRRR